MATASISGLISGMDIDSLISGLMGIEKQNLTQLQNEKADLTTKQTAFDSFSAQLLGLKSAIAQLTKSTFFQNVVATSSATGVATASTTSTATIGSYNIHVDNLASGNKLSSKSFTSTTDALGFSGEVLVNGKALNIAASDSVSSILTKINGLNAGVQATIITAGASDYRLSLAATGVGVANAIQLTDASGSGVLQQMGILTTGTALGNVVSGGAASNAIAGATLSVASMLGLNSAGSGTIQIKGVNVDVNLATDSLQDIAAAINGAGVPGVNASVNTVTANGTTKYNLVISGVTDASDLVDSNNVLSTLGVLKHGLAHETTQAKDAQFSIDGVAMTRATNTVSDALTGVTLNLAGQGDSTLTISRDTSTIQSAVQSFVTAYNSVQKFISDQSSYDSTTKKSGDLFGDSTLLNVESDLSNIVGGEVPGLWGSSADLGKVSNTLAAIGITMDQTGTLVIDSSALSTAISDNPDQVAALFSAVGRTTDSSVGFISAGTYSTGSYDASDPRIRSAYDIVITNAAKQAQATAGVAQTQANTASEKLSFSGGLFGSGVDLYLGATNTLADTVSQINSDARLKGIVKASISGDGKLVLQSYQYGSAINFSVKSNQAASSNNSGIGTDAIAVNGQDVEGTIGGFAASGKGQVLTGLTYARALASKAQTDALAADETLTFGGAMFSDPVQVTLRAGMTQAQVVEAINGDASLSGKLSAELVDGKLAIRTTKDGLGQKFTVYSDQAAAANSTGIGSATIKADNSGAPGDISVLVQSDTTGAHGSVSLSLGYAQLLDRTLSSVTDSMSGTIAYASQSLQSQQEYLDQEIQAETDRETADEARLRSTFTDMETALGKLKSLSSYMTSQLGSLPSWSSSTSSSSGVNSLLSA